MRLRRSAKLAAAVPVAILVALATAQGAGATDLVAHRAMYDLKLESSRGGDVNGAIGSMAYEVQDACDGWATQQRLQMTISNRDGQDVQMLSEYTTWESKDGLKLRFRMKQTTDQAVTSDVAGDAKLTGTGKAGTAHFTSPEDSTKQLPAGTVFPMMHTAALLAAGEAGNKFLAVPLFDGTTATGAQDSSIVVIKWQGPEAAYRYPELTKLPSGHFHIAFFDRGPEATQPDYEVSMRYWTNGVADDLDMDFGDFVMGGKLTEFKLLPGKC
jgi:hypothetical protein